MNIEFARPARTDYYKGLRLDGISQTSGLSPLVAIPRHRFSRSQEGGKRQWLTLGKLCTGNEEIRSVFLRDFSFIGPIIVQFILLSSGRMDKEASRVEHFFYLELITNELFKRRSGGYKDN